MVAWAFVLAASCGEAAPAPVDDADASGALDAVDAETDLGDTEAPDAADVEEDASGPVTITVRLDGVAQAGIRVMQGGTGVALFTDALGQVVATVDEAVPGEVGFIASHPRARSRGATIYPGKREAEIELTSYDVHDNEGYAFQDPGEPTRRGSTGQCAHCHESINADWFASPHRDAARNPVVQSLYRAGVLPGLNPGCADGDCAGATEFGGCADCHAPGIDGALGGRDLREATGIALDYGVHCDVCHRVESVDMAADPGVAGRLRLHRPSERSTSSALGAWQPLTFGPDYDVSNPRMGLVQRDHFRSAALCAGCHQLDQAVLVPGASIDRERWPSGKLPIQSTYAEWLAGPLGGESATVPCQSCHMPPAPEVGNGADVAISGAAGGAATGWVRPPGAVRRHVWSGPKQPGGRLLALAATVGVATSVADGEVVARVTVRNVGSGHALPTGEPMRSMLLLVEARCGEERLAATGGDAVPDFGGSLGAKGEGEDWSVWPGAAVGDVVRVVRRPGGWRDYPGVGAFGDGRFDAAGKGMPVEEVAGSARIVAVDADGDGGGRVVFDGALPEGDVAYLGGPDGDEPVDGAVARAWAGAPGFGFARVLVGADGARMVPHYAAVDVASDNRLPPGASWTSEHRFAATCAAPEVRATLVHRAYPFELARGAGWPLTESVMATARSGPVPALAEVPDEDPDPEVVRVALRAAPMTVAIDGQEVTAMAYNGQIPGPTLRVRRGQRLVVDFENALSMPTTIHWHGLHVPNAMDGVTWASAPVAPGGRFTYDFTVTQAGTFWYHPHFDTEHQIDRGLFGAIVVEDAADPVPDQDLVFVLDTWGEAHGEPSRDGGHGGGGGPRVEVDDRARVWRVNGVVKPVVAVRGGTVVRARFVNASNTGYVALRWPGLTVIGTDQGLLPGGRYRPERLILAPGDRAEAEWRVGEAGFDIVTDRYSLNGGDSGGAPVELASVVVEAPEPAPAGLTWPFPASWPAPHEGASDVVWVLQGSSHTGAWLINGEAFPAVAAAELALGQRAVLELRNLSDTEHPFHLHGHAFEVLSVDGEPPPVRLVEDTVNVGIYQTVRVALVADNPGDWMAHCHILPHTGGMMTVLRVAPRP